MFPSTVFPVLVWERASGIGDDDGNQECRCQSPDANLSSIQGEEIPGALLGSVNDLVWCTTVDGSKLLFLNAAAERIYGRPLDELRSNPDVWLEAVHPEDRSEVESNLGNLLKLGQIQQEYRIVRPDGQTRWLQDRISVICDESGAPQHVGGIATDITEQKLAELPLQESKAVFHSLVESLPLNVVRKDLQGRIVFGNQRYCQTVKQPLEDLLGKTDFVFFPKDLATKYREDDLRVIAVLAYSEIESTPTVLSVASGLHVRRRTSTAVMSSCWG